MSVKVVCIAPDGTEMPIEGASFLTMGDAAGDLDGGGDALWMFVQQYGQVEVASIRLDYDQPVRFGK